jgi:hypothetical protein
MKIITVNFDFAAKKDYSRLMNVYKKSIKKNMPGTWLTEINLPAPRIQPGDQKMLAANTVKIDAWIEELDRSTENVVLSDCDMLSVGNIEPVFNLNFDIAITKRSGGLLPFNGGIVLVKNTISALNFMKLWKSINRQMYQDRIFHMIWREKYAGMNQAALGYILEKEKFDAKVIQIPCSKYNLCDDDWQNVNNDSIFVHIKGKLRQFLLKNYNVNAMPDNIKKVAKIWKDIENENL